MNALPRSSVSDIAINPFPTGPIEKSIGPVLQAKPPMPQSTNSPMKRFKPDEAYGKQSLCDHAAEKAYEARQAYGGEIDYSAMQRLLEDRRFVRYPVRLCFDARPLQAGEFAFMQVIEEGQPDKGFILFVHTHFETHHNVLPMLIAYHMVCVNYGEIASHEAAEIFGATLLGMDAQTYYQMICQLADEMPAPNETTP